MKSKELKNYNLPDRTYNEVLEAKPKALLLIMMIIGLILIIVKAYVYGSSLLFFGLACLIFLPGRRIIEFYDDHMIVYNRARKGECNIIYYEDVNTWEYKYGVSKDELIINMEDGSVQKCEGYSKLEFENILNKYMKNKKLANETKFIFTKDNKN